jgi:hypothetical protein
VKPTIDTLSPAMKSNMLLALSMEPRPLRRLHYSQAKALEKRGLATVELEVYSHPIDVRLGCAIVRLTDAGRGIANAILREQAPPARPVSE